MDSKNTTSISHGYTLIELVVVIAIIGVAFGIITYRSGAVNFWKEENFIRKLAETISFLHHQAVVDQNYYELRFEFKEKPHYRVGAIRNESSVHAGLAGIASDAGNLTLELTAFLSPALGETETIIPPPSFPSLAEPQEFPAGFGIEDIVTMRGRINPQEEGSAYILFSPRGFSEFAVVHLRLSAGAQKTIFVDPFSGIAKVLDGYREFEWKYNSDTQSES